VPSPAAGVEICIGSSTPEPILTADPRLESTFRSSQFRIRFEALAEPFSIGWRRMDGLAGRIAGFLSALETNRRIGPAEGIGRVLATSLQEMFVPDGNFERPWTPRVRPVAEAIRAMQLGQFDGLLAGIGHVRTRYGSDEIRRRSWPPQAMTILEFQLDLTRSAGPWWAREGLAIVSERPVVSKFDERGRLHSTDGPALRWSDGFEIWALGGVTVPSWMVERPESITLRDISGAENVEVRRELIDLYGTARYLRGIRARLLSRDEFGRLWRWTETVTSPWGWRTWEEVHQVVEVLNATPEPDGSRHTYFLHVPPDVTTAHEAVAWTFGLTAETYLPEQES
jgi:hypothetical protein